MEGILSLIKMTYLHSGPYAAEHGTVRVFMTRQKTYHLIFATDGKGTTQLAHVYAETVEQAFQAATHWRDEKHPDLKILRVRAEPNGFRVGPIVLAPVIEEEREGATFVDMPDISLPYQLRNNCTERTNE